MKNVLKQFGVKFYIINTAARKMCDMKNMNLFPSLANMFYTLGSNYLCSKSY